MVPSQEGVELRAGGNVCMWSTPEAAETREVAQRGPGRGKDKAVSSPWRASVAQGLAGEEVPPGAEGAQGAVWREEGERWGGGSGGGVGAGVVAAEGSG